MVQGRRRMGGTGRRLIAATALLAAAIALPSIGTAQAPVYDGRPAFHEGVDFGYSCASPWTSTAGRGPRTWRSDATTSTRTRTRS
jgi:hypothetical protein